MAQAPKAAPAARAWRVEFEDQGGVSQMCYPPNLQRCRDLIELFRRDEEALRGLLRARIYHNNHLEETWPLSPSA